MLKKAKEFISTKRGKALSVIATGNVALVGGVSQITSLAADAKTQNIVQNVINVILDIFFYIGILLLCWSVGMLVLAFKNEDADSKSRAMMMLVVSAALIGLKPLLNTVLKGTGFSVE